MSTNKTENYQLHVWTAEDEGRLEEINENFARLDGASRVVTGTYTGDGSANRVIELGFTPRAVLVMNSESEMNSGYHSYGGLALPSFPASNWMGGPERPTVTVTEEGFFVYYYHSSGSSYTVETNYSGKLYYYLAVR